MGGGRKTGVDGDQEMLLLGIGIEMKQLISLAKELPPPYVGTGQGNSGGSRRASNKKYIRFQVYFLSYPFKSDK